MKTIIKSSLLLLCGLSLLTACTNDREDNPILQAPTNFVLNEPSVADASVDIAHSTSIELTCSQPNYGYPAATNYGKMDTWPAATNYVVQVSVDPNMKDYTELSTIYTTTTMNLDAQELASTVTAELLAADPSLTEADFPKTTPIYFRVRAYLSKYGTSDVMAGTEILSNIVSIKNARVVFSLPPVTTPEHLYLIGNFCGWDWNNAVEMVPVNGATNIFWHMVYIDKADGGVKFNSDKAWDGNEVGFSGLNSVSGDLGSEICDLGGNIGSTRGGWYLMVVTTSVNGRNIVYDAQFLKPEVWTMGWLLGDGGVWTELTGDTFTVPEAADGEFVSPAFRADLPGNDDNGCVRVYVKIPTFDWWKSEFIVLPGDTKISYRGNGGDQDRAGCNAGEHLYLNFSNDTGHYGK